MYMRTLDSDELGVARPVIAIYRTHAYMWPPSLRRDGGILREEFHN